jgi:UDP-N-acetyl-2-amino-2-deoxyglucuronate dehydrogenase
VTGSSGHQHKEDTALKQLNATTSITPDLQQQLHLHGTSGTIGLSGTEDVWISQWETQRERCREGLCGHGGTADVGGRGGGGGAAAVLEHGVEALGRELDNFVAAVQGREELLIDGNEGRRSLEVVRAVYDSASQNGAPVHLVRAAQCSGRLSIGVSLLPLFRLLAANN